MKNNYYKSLVLNIIIIISSLIGIFTTLFSNNFMSLNVFYYYTIESNIVLLIISFIYIIYSILVINRFIKEIPKIIFLLKYIITVGITITLIIFTFTLIPQIVIEGNIIYLTSLSNISLHFICPIIAIITFKLYENKYNGKYYYLLGIIEPLCYFIFSMILSMISVNGVFKNFDGTMSKFPYFFLDYETHGWFKIGNNMFTMGVCYWFIIIFILTIIISKLIIKKKDK